METLNPSPGQSYPARAAYEAIELRIDWLLDLIKGLYCRVARYDGLLVMERTQGNPNEDAEVDAAEKLALKKTIRFWDNYFVVTIEPRDPNDERQRRAIFGDEEK